MLTALLTGHTVFMIWIGFFTCTRTSITPRVSTFIFRSSIENMEKEKCMLQMYIKLDHVSVLSFYTKRVKECV